MKKLVSVLFALLLVGSFAFADVTVGAWGRFIFSPASSIDGSDNAAFSAPSWADGSRVGVTIAGTSDNAGFQVQYFANGNVLKVGDNANTWVKFNDMVKLYGGKKQGDALRGKIDDSDTLNAMPSVDITPLVTTDANNMYVAVGATGKDDLFQRFYPKLGLLLEITPAEGVYLGASVDSNGSDLTNAVLTEDMLKKIQIGGGYVIPNVGHLRAQYIGNVDDAVKYFQVAFAYTAMEGVLVDAGLKYQTESKLGQSLATVAGTYNKDALSALARFQVGFGEDASGDDLSIKASADVGYTVAAPLAIGAEVAFAKRADPIGFSVAPYGKVSYGNGSFKAAFVYSSFTDYPYISDTGVLGVDSYTAWAIPLIITFSF